MTATHNQLKRYAVGLARRLWSAAVDLDAEPGVIVESAGTLAFQIAGTLPDSAIPKPARIVVAERWEPAGAEYRRREYGYELIDYPRNRRRAYHRHDGARFLEAYEVAVHEHCEEVLGDPTCAHYSGDPVVDGYRGIDRLMSAWTDEKLRCNDLRCLESPKPDYLAIRFAKSSPVASSSKYA